METRKLLKNIRETAVKCGYPIQSGTTDNTVNWKKFPWREVSDCISSELNIRKHLYPEEQFSNIESKVEGLFSLLYDDMNVDNIIYAMDKLIEIFELLPDTDYTWGKYEEANFMRAYWHYQRHATVIVLGDSHVNFFSGAELLDFIPIGHKVNTCPILGEKRFTPLHLGPCWTIQMPVTIQWKRRNGCAIILLFRVPRLYVRLEK